MKIIKAKVEEIEQQPGYSGLIKQIERGGRVCYKSEDKITDDSAERFVNVLIKHGHYAPLEHGTVYLRFPIYQDGGDLALASFFKNNRFSYVHDVYLDKPDIGLSTGKEIVGYNYVTTNYRVIIENDLEEKLKDFICNEPEVHHRRRRSFMVTCDRGVTHELVRHRVFSFNQESTRYVNYSQDKWDNEITVIEPCFWDKDDPRYYTWKDACKAAERYYMELLQDGATPQEARSVLPNSMKTELLITGFEDFDEDNNIDELGWNHFLKLRCDKAAHPQAREIAFMIKDLLYPPQAQKELIKDYEVEQE